MEMAKSIYAAIPRLDPYVEDEDGWFDWAAPGDEVHRRSHGHAPFRRVIDRFVR